jgi:3-oxoacyl-[acyl-carrier protein] reductase
MELGLRGKRALVTAASRGLGRAVAESLLAEDCRVCVTSSSEPSIEAAAREMAKAGGEVHALAADLGRDEECDRLFAWATSTSVGWTSWSTTPSGHPRAAYWRCPTISGGSPST